jgi:hypothetical protein
VNKYIFLGLISLFAIGDFSAGAAAQGLTSLEQLTTRKQAYELFVFELPRLVESWTRNCIERENQKIGEGVTCWQDAAAAVEQYSSELSGPLVERVHRLKEAWLQRINQLQSSPLRSETEVAAAQQLATVSEPTAEADPAIGGLITRRRAKPPDAQPENRKLPRKPKSAARVSAKQDKSSKANERVVALKADPNSPMHKARTKNGTKRAVDVRDQCKALFGPLSQIRRHRGDWYCTQP